MPHRLSVEKRKKKEKRKEKKKGKEEKHFHKTYAKQFLNTGRP